MFTICDEYLKVGMWYKRSKRGLFVKRVDGNTIKLDTTIYGNESKDNIDPLGDNNQTTRSFVVDDNVVKFALKHASCIRFEPGCDISLCLGQLGRIRNSKKLVFNLPSDGVTQIQTNKIRSTKKLSRVRRNKKSSSNVLPQLNIELTCANEMSPATIFDFINAMLETSLKETNFFVVVHYKYYNTLLPLYEAASTVSKISIVGSQGAYIPSHTI